MTTSPDVDTSRDRRRRLVAIAAGASVVGIGAIVTLAAWTAPEFSTGTFTAGTFDIEGTTDGSAYSSHATAGAAASLSFTSTFSNLSPNDTVYAPYAVRLKANTTSAATVVLQNPTATSGTVTNLTYTLVKTAGFTCDATTVSNAVTAGDALKQNVAMTVGGGTFSLAKGSPVSSAGAPQYLCFAVTAGASLSPGQTGSVTWQLTATSS